MRRHPPRPPAVSQQCRQRAVAACLHPDIPLHTPHITFQSNLSWVGVAVSLSVFIHAAMRCCASSSQNCLTSNTGCSFRVHLACTKCKYNAYLLIVLSLLEHLGCHIHERTRFMCQVKGVSLVHVEVRCAGAPASFGMAAICCHSLGQSLLQMIVAPLLQPDLGVLAGGKGVSVHHTSTLENIMQPTSSYMLAKSMWWHPHNYIMQLLPEERSLHCGVWAGAVCTRFAQECVQTEV